MKLCPRCKINKLVSDYNVRKSGRRIGQVRTPCRDCEHEIFKIWSTDNKAYLIRKQIGKKFRREKNNFYERKRKFVLRSPTLFGNHTAIEWNELKQKCKFTCLRCKEVEPKIKLTEDHIIPISKGGSNNIDNIQSLCIKCNQIKNNKVIIYAVSTIT